MLFKTLLLFKVFLVVNDLSIGEHGSLVNFKLILLYNSRSIKFYFMNSSISELSLLLLILLLISIEFILEFTDSASSKLSNYGIY